MNVIYVITLVISVNKTELEISVMHRYHFFRELVISLVHLQISVLMVATKDQLWNSLTFPWPVPDGSWIFPVASSENPLGPFKRNCFSNVELFTKMLLVYMKMVSVHQKFHHKLVYSDVGLYFEYDYCTEITEYWSSPNVMLIKSNFYLTFFKVSIFPV